LIFFNKNKRLRVVVLADNFGKLFDLNLLNLLKNKKNKIYSLVGA
jgi:hypothetical protein